MWAVWSWKEVACVVVAVKGTRMLMEGVALEISERGTGTATPAEEPFDAAPAPVTASSPGAAATLGSTRLRRM